MEVSVRREDPAPSRAQALLPCLEVPQSTWDDGFFGKAEREFCLLSVHDWGAEGWGRAEREDALLPLRASQLQKPPSSSLLHIVDQILSKNLNGWFVKEKHRCFTGMPDDGKPARTGKTSCLGEAPAEVSTAGRMEQPPPGCCCCGRDAAAAAAGMLPLLLPLLPPGEGRWRGPFRVAPSRREGVGITSR